MDEEQEKAARMEAAEALYMISTRADKRPTTCPASSTKPSKRGRKKKVPDRFAEVEEEDTSRSSKQSNLPPAQTGKASRGRGSRGRGDGGKKRGGKTRGGKQNKSFKLRPREDHAYNSFGSDQDSSRLAIDTDTDTEPYGQSSSPVNKRRREPKIKNERKLQRVVSGIGFSNDSDSSLASEDGDVKPDVMKQAVGFTGVVISSPSVSSPNLPSHGIVSGLKQVSLASRQLSSSGLPSIGMNLQSMTLPSLSSDSVFNLPSIPLELGALQLSSTPTPNLSSLPDIKVLKEEKDEDLTEEHGLENDRKKSEKFLPLKKRKLHQPDPKEVGPRSPIPTSPISDPEADDMEPESPPRPPVTFTVQAPPMITMQTLMEIKTALTADDDGDLPLHIAVVHENMRMVNKLICLMKIAGKGVDKFNKQQQTPLHLAVKLNFVEAVDILIKAGASVNAVDITGSSAIHMAVQRRSNSCLQKILECCQNVDLNTRNFDGLTPLHTAVDNGDLEQVQLLLRYGANIDITDGKSGRTALFRAAESNQKQMVELLLHKGANPDIPNYAGVTCAMAAQGRHLHGILKLLGSVATDYVMDYQTKMAVLSMEPKPSVCVGMLKGGKQVLSESDLKSLNSSRLVAGELGHSMESLSASSGSEDSTARSKVFHKVYLVSSNTQKSSSEPPSPEIKMEQQDGERSLSERGGLLSLPDMALLERAKAKTIPQAQFILSSRPGVVRGDTSPRIVVQAATAGDQKSKSASFIGAERVFPSVLQRQFSGNTEVEPRKIVLQVPMGKGLSSPTTTSVDSVASKSNVSEKPGQSVTILTAPKSGQGSTPETVTLTDMQARLYQKLLEAYSIETTVPSSVLSRITNSQPSSPVVSHQQMPRLVSPQSSYLSQLRPGTLTTESTRPSLARQLSRNAAHSSPQPGSDLSDRGRPIISHVQNFSYGQGISGTALSTTSSPPNTPLNLSSKPTMTYSPVAEREKVDDSKGMPTLGAFAQQTSEKGPGVINVDVRPNSEEMDTRFEIYLEKKEDKTYLSPSSAASPMSQLPDGKQSQTSLPNTSSSIAGTILKAKDGTGGPVSTPSPHGATSVSAETANVVRSYLSRQHSLHSQPTSSSSPTPPYIRSQGLNSAPSPFTLAKVSLSSSTNRQGSPINLSPLTRPNRSDSSLASSISRDEVADLTSPVLSRPLDFSLPSRQIDSYQLQAVDLSQSRTKSNLPAPDATLSALNQSATKNDTIFSLHFHRAASTPLSAGAVVGFSGAIVSLAHVSDPKSAFEVKGKVLSLESPVVEEISVPAVKDLVVRKRGRKPKSKTGDSAFEREPVCVERVNSETDLRLKKYLDAKASNLSHPDFSKIEDSKDKEKQQQPHTGEKVTEHKKANQVYKTVGIFSGDVQHVVIDGPSSSAISTLPMNSSINTSAVGSPRSTPLPMVIPSKVSTLPMTVTSGLLQTVQRKSPVVLDSASEAESDARNLEMGRTPEISSRLQKTSGKLGESNVRVSQASSAPSVKVRPEGSKVELESVPKGKDHVMEVRAKPHHSPSSEDRIQQTKTSRLDEKTVKSESKNLSSDQSIDKPRKENNSQKFQPSGTISSSVLNYAVKLKSSPTPGRTEESVPQKSREKNDSKPRDATKDKTQSSPKSTKSSSPSEESQIITLISSSNTSNASSEDEKIQLEISDSEDGEDDEPPPLVIEEIEEEEEEGTSE